MRTDARNPVVGATRAKVLALLVKHADMDGLVTVSQGEIAAELGITYHSVGDHIYVLAAEGALTIRLAGAGFKSMNAIQLAEDVLT